MTMKTIKVAEATERQLDWLVARIEGDELPKDGGKGLDYSTDWACGGPILEREGISIYRMTSDWSAAYNPSGAAQDGPTPLAAAMRVHVYSKLGDTAEVPEELLERIQVATDPLTWREGACFSKCG